MTWTSDVPLSTYQYWKWVDDVSLLLLLNAHIFHCLFVGFPMANTSIMQIN